MKIKLVTLLELTTKFKVKKATLHYYTQLGLLVPDIIAGKMSLFEETSAIKQWKEIQKLRKNNTLSEIREIFSKKNANKAR